MYRAAPAIICGPTVGATPAWRWRRLSRSTKRTAVGVPENSNPQKNIKKKVKWPRVRTPSDKPNLDGFSTGPETNERGGVGSADFGLGRESKLGSKVSSGLCCVAIEYFSVDSHRGTSHFTTRLYDLSPVKCQLRMKCKMRLNSILRPQSANLRVAPSLSNLVC